MPKTTRSRERFTALHSNLFSPSGRRSVIKKHTLPKRKSVVIHWNRIYRYVREFGDLFGFDVHVSKGELGCLAFTKDTDFCCVPFSHVSEDGLLFEMEEFDPDTLIITPKIHQPGTGVVCLLHPDLVAIKRIFYDPELVSDDNKSLLIKKFSGIEQVEVSFTRWQDECQFVLELPKVASKLTL